MSWYKYTDGTTLMGWILVAILFALSSVGAVFLVLLLVFGYRFIEG